MELCFEAKVLNGPRTTEIAAEEALVARCRRQDVEAFGKIVDAYQSRVLGFVRRMVPNGEDASDITQEVFIRAYQSFGRFDGRASVRTWLFRIAYNLCVDRSRRAKRALPETRLDAFFEEEEAMQIADQRWCPQGSVLNDELAHVVERAIESMSEKLRSVLLLHDRDDLAYEEIARVLEIPVGTVKSRLFLARNHLQGVLSTYLGTGEGNV